MVFNLRMDYNKFTMELLDKFKRKIELTLAESRQDEELIFEYIADKMDFRIIRKG